MMGDTGVAPTNFWRQQLSDLSDEKFAAGNFSDCGKTSKAFQHIPAENRAEENNIEKVQASVIAAEKKTINRDYDICRRLKRKKTIYGFIQSNDITSKNISIILLDEGSVKLYRKVCVKDILYFDATGSVIKPIRGFSQIYLYSLTTRHPFGLSPPVLLVEAILSSHNAFNISKVLHIL